MSENLHPFETVSVDELATMPGHLIRRLNQFSNAIFSDQMRAGGMDLTSVQYAALVILSQSPGIDQARLAAKIAFDRSTIGGVLRRLEEKGLIERALDEDDRRARRLHLTEVGREVLRKLQPEVNEVQHKITATLSAQERQDFMSLIRKMIGEERS